VGQVDTAPTVSSILGRLFSEYSDAMRFVDKGVASNGNH